MPSGGVSIPAAIRELREACDGLYRELYPRLWPRETAAQREARVRRSHVYRALRALDGTWTAPTVPTAALWLPATFVPTHQTAGLPGFPAVDLFAKGGTPVLIGFSGMVTKLSGHAPTPSVAPGGPYGWSFYVNDAYYVTHLGTRSVKVGQRLSYGELVGTVADYAAATNGVTPSHVHLGRRV